MTSSHSRNVVCLTNDPSGQRNTITIPAAALAFLYTASHQQNGLQWSTNSEFKINEFLFSPRTFTEAEETYAYNFYYSKDPMLKEIFALNGKGRQLYEFNGLRFTLVCGDFGLLPAEESESVGFRKMKFILIPGLENKVTSV